MNGPLTYDVICKMMGRLYIESKLEAEQLRQALEEAQATLVQCQQERNEALDLARQLGK